MKTRNLCVLAAIGLIGAACSAEPVADEPTDQSEAQIGPAVYAAIALGTCLVDENCRAAVALALGYAVYAVTELSGNALQAAQAAANAWAEQNNACDRNEQFTPKRTDRAIGCINADGTLRCYSARHYPCNGIHTRGTLAYNESRGGRCVRVTKPKAVRCEGDFAMTGGCEGSTESCGEGGYYSSGVHEQ